MRDESISLTVPYPAYNPFKEIEKLSVIRIVLLMLLFVCVFAYETPTFLEGTFEEGYGVSLYVTPEGELRTLGNDWDLNDDNWLDIVLINEFFWDQEQIPETYSYVFWGSPDGFEQTHCDSFMTNGAECAALADFNRDGWTDIVVANSKSDYSKVIYGSSKGYTHARQDSFKAKENHGSISVADLDRDGWLDLVWSHWVVWGDGNSRVYWGSYEGFSFNKTDLFPVAPAHGNVVADFNNDGYADILWVVYYTWGAVSRRASVIFWGRRGGFRSSCRTKLEAIGPGDDISVADLNKDGLLDIVIPNRSAKPPPWETYHDYSYIYYGEGNRSFRLDSLYAYGPWGASIADIDGDGWLDIVFACAGDESSLIYYGSSSGFNESDVIPVKGVSCAYLADFDEDGDCDMVLGKQASSQMAFSYQSDGAWDCQTWYGVGGVDAGITRDLGSPSTRRDEAWFISPTITITSSPDSTARLEDISIDDYTTWQGDGQPEGAGVDLWVSASPYPYGGEWTDWIEISSLTSDSVRGRSFRYRLCFHTGFRTSVVVRKAELTTHLVKAENKTELPKIVRISAREFAIWWGGDGSNRHFFVYDITGRKVRTIQSDSWGYALLNGDDDLGRPLPAGIYFLAIPEGRGFSTYKLTILTP